MQHKGNKLHERVMDVSVLRTEKNHQFLLSDDFDKFVPNMH